MKKALLFFLVLLLAVPAISFAGSATSRWDLTIGGFVKVDAGYGNQAQGPAPGGLETYFADRDNAYGNQNVSNKSGYFAMATGQTTLNFLVKGPDTWGAKTTAFIQGNFVGQTNNNGTVGTRYGTFTLSHAYVDFTWASTKLIVGQNWQSWGFLPSYNFIGLYDLLLAGRGNTVPQVTLVQQFAKSFYASVGIQEPYNMRDQAGGSAILAQSTNPLGLSGTVTQNNGAGASAILPPNSVGTTQAYPAWTRVTTQLPDFTAEVGFKSAACGKIGPNAMQFAVGGMWGQDKLIYMDPQAPASTLKNQYSTGTVNRWAAAFKGFIPIIPEKNLNKAGALSVSGSMWTGQNLSNWFLGARNIGSMVPYDQVENKFATPNYAVPTTVGGWGQISYYLTDKVYVNGLYGYIQNNVSRNFMLAYPNQINKNAQWIANIFYDVNPAVRVAFEYSYIKTWFNNNGLNNGGNAAGGSEQLAVMNPATGQAAAYASNGPGLSTTGSYQVARVALFYFF